MKKQAAALTTSTLRRTPRWAVAAAYAVPLCILPSAIWRAVGVFDGTFTEDGTPAWYPLSLSVLSLGLGLLTLGLVHSWGEQIPRWVPGLGGRPVPIKAATIPATVGAALLFLLMGYFLYQVNNPPTAVNPDLVLLGDKGDLRPMQVRDPEMHDEANRFGAPLLAWPILLLAVTSAYHRRRSSWQ